MALTKTYTIEIDGGKSQATVGQLKQEIQRLEEELDGVVVGSAEADAAIRKLGAAKGSLKELEDAVDALDPKAQSAALLDFANGFTGAFGVATVAAENFGLASADSMEKYEAKLLSIITVMQGVEAIHKAMNSETQSVVRSVLGLGNGWTLAGVKAKLFGTTTRAAITATGIGFLIILLATVVANWDTISKKVVEFKDSIAKNFPAIGKFVDGVIAKLRDVASFLSFGFIDDAATAAVRKLEEAEAKMAEGRIARRKNLIAEEAAAGRSTYNMRQQQLADELKLLALQGKKETQEYADKLSEIRQLKNAHDKSLRERDEKAWAEALAKEKAASEAAYKAAVEAYNKRRQLEGAALEAEQAAHNEARKRKYEMAKLDGVSLQRLLRIEIETLQLSLINYKRYGSEWLAIKNQITEKEKAIRDANMEDERKAREKKQRMDNEALAKMQEQNDILVIEMKLRGATEKEITKATIAGLEAQIQYMEKAGLAYTKAFAELKLQVKELQDSLVPTDNSLMGKVLTKLFGVDPDALEKVKESLNESFATIYNSIAQISDALVSDALLKLDAYTEYLDEQLELAKERQEEAEQGMLDAQQRRADLESQLEDSRGAKREYLIRQIAKERAEEARLAAEKKKAAAEEAKIAKQKEEAEKKRQELEAKGQLLAAASATASNIATAAEAVRAGVSAVSGAAKLPFPANLAAIVASVAAVAAAVVSAKKLATTVQQSKMAKGGALYGPSHDSGGITGTGRFANIEVEGGEFVTNKHAYRNNRETIERINAIGNSVRFVAIPEHHVRRKFADGGELPGGKGAASVAVAGDTTAVANGDLTAIRSLLQSIDANTLRSADKEPGYIGPWESRKIVDQAKSLDADEQAGKLF